MSRWFSITSAALLVLGLAYNSWAFWPDQPERYTAPTRLSLLIQRHVPWLYRPPASVFASRYGGGATATAAVLGPDCRRLAVNNPLLTEQSGYAAISTKYCSRFIDIRKLSSLIKSSAGDSTGWHYTSLNSGELAGLEIKFRPGDVIETSSKNIAAFVTRGGWGDLEPWGVWSVGKRAKLELPLDLGAFGPQVTVSVMAGALIPNQVVMVSVNGQRVADLKFSTEASEQSFTIPREAVHSGVLAFMLNIQRPVAPADVIAGNSDPRPLGISLLRIKVT